MSDVVAAIKAAGALGDDDKGVVLLTCSAETPRAKAPDTCNGMFLLAGGDDAVVTGVGKEVSLALSGKGGGRKGVYQGKCERVDKAGEAANRLLPGFIEATCKM
jgi:hypothetical protein